MRQLLTAIVVLGGLMLLVLIQFQPKVKNMTNKNNNGNMTVLIWLWPFGRRFNLRMCKSFYDIEGCFLTADRSLYNESDGVIIHHRDIDTDLSNLPQLQRPSSQKWIWMNFEPPTLLKQLPGIDSLFNLTLNYRQDADIEVPFGSLVAAASRDDFVLPSKNKLVCWIVSNWRKEYERVKYYKELHKHMKVHVHGEASGRRISREDYTSILTSCKFYLSFENSIHTDYITEKFFKPLSLGTVPVVLGPPRRNYERFIQGDAFIHVNDFDSPKELAEYLLLLDKDENAYLKYFEWRRHFRVVVEKHTSLKRSCLSCDYLRLHKEKKTFKLNKWFWEE
ncbi:4-galactosyl-N-acetylglucosaminide 3-alpha-L-fucosyltransferase 9-like [Brachionichthys hirsutus]|uniref:4-galactosyl-N-acetylglucosaminide 3-alpha-L-fucosyltransferase 9-like n=1 Tax=Brachionichthys hirsutus TaxID=412623 RepID=UPI00360434BC